MTREHEISAALALQSLFFAVASMGRMSSYHAAILRAPEAERYYFREVVERESRTCSRIAGELADALESMPDFAKRIIGPDVQEVLVTLEREARELRGEVGL